MIDPEIRFILKDSIPSMHMQVVLPSGDRVFMHFVHPDPPNPKYATDTTERDAELLKQKPLRKNRMRTERKRNR